MGLFWTTQDEIRHGDERVREALREENEGTHEEREQAVRLSGWLAERRRDFWNERGETYW